MKQETQDTRSDNEMLLYDADCPLCKWYTQKFVEQNLLPVSGRVPFNKMGPYVKQNIDVQRAKNEIALYNKATGETLYGIESLVKLLSKKWKWVEKGFKYGLINGLFSRLYAFISYNRKIIVPSPKTEDFLSCFPEPKPAYRIAFIAFCMVVVNFIVGAYFRGPLAVFGHWNYPCREMVFFAGQLVFQGLFFYLFKIKNFYDYAGHVSFISFKGAFFLGGFYLFAVLLENAGINVTLFKPFFFGAIFMYMFLEHRRVTDLTGFPAFLSYTWLLFRVGIYPLAFRI